MTTKNATKKKVATPAPVPAKAPTRKELLVALGAGGYIGPTNFTVTVLRQILDWVEAGSPKDLGAVPNGAMFAVHPDLKPIPRAKAARLTKWQQGYQEAMSDIAALGDDLKAVKRWIADNQTRREGHRLPAGHDGRAGVRHRGPTFCHLCRG